MRVDISGLNKAIVLLALYKNATIDIESEVKRPPNEAFSPTSLEKAQLVIDNCIKEGNFNIEEIDLGDGKRQLYINLKDDTFDSGRYDQMQSYFRGRVAKRVISLLRSELDFSALQKELEELEQLEAISKAKAEKELNQKICQRDELINITLPRIREQLNRFRNSFFSCCYSRDIGALAILEYAAQYSVELLDSEIKYVLTKQLLDDSNVEKKASVEKTMKIGN